jgi:hypothetical protein
LKNYVSEVERLKTRIEEQTLTITGLTDERAALTLQISKAEESLRNSIDAINTIDIDSLSVDVNRKISDYTVKLDTYIGELKKNVYGDMAGGYSYSNTGHGIKKNKSRRSKKGGKSVRKRSKKVVRKRTKSKSKRRYRK